MGFTAAMVIPREWTHRLGRGVVLLLVSGGLMVVATGVATPPPADALSPPVVDAPRCYETALGSTACDDYMLPNGTSTEVLGMTATVSGTATPGGTFQVSMSPAVPACQTSDELGCYDKISHHHDGGLFYLPYHEHILPHSYRTADWMEAPMSTQAPTSRSVLPATGQCREEWNGVYIDGGEFASRAAAARTCTFRFGYTNAAGAQVPIDNLLGPTWLRIRSSVTVRRAAGQIESHLITSLVRIDGELAAGPVAQCVPPETATNGVKASFRSKSSVNSLIDSVANWAFQPTVVVNSTYHANSTHSGWAQVTPNAQGQLRGTLTLQSWQGTSQDVCSVVVGPAPGEAALTTLSAPSIGQIYGNSADLAVTVSPAATGQVSVIAGNRTITAPLVNGRATVTIPAKTLEPGTHPLEVTYAGAPGAFAPSTATTTIEVTQAAATMQVKSPKKVKRGKTATVKVAVTAPGVTPTGSLTVRVAGEKAVTAALDGRGQAKVKIKLRKRGRPGKRGVTVTYGGDRFVTSNQAAGTKIKVTK